MKTPEELARMAWREEFDDGSPEQSAWRALPIEDQLGLLAEQRHEHLVATKKFYRDMGINF